MGARGGEVAFRRARGAARGFVPDEGQVVGEADLSGDGVDPGAHGGGEDDQAQGASVLAGSAAVSQSDDASNREVQRAVMFVFMILLVLSFRLFVNATS